MIDALVPEFNFGYADYRILEEMYDRTEQNQIEEMFMPIEHNKERRPRMDRQKEAEEIRALIERNENKRESVSINVSVRMDMEKEKRDIAVRTKHDKEALDALGVLERIERDKAARAKKKKKTAPTRRYKKRKNAPRTLEPTKQKKREIARLCAARHRKKNKDALELLYKRDVDSRFRNSVLVRQRDLLIERRRLLVEIIKARYVNCELLKSFS